MSYILFSETKPVARKEHRCVWCNENILIGEKHIRADGMYDGFQHDRWHNECRDAANRYWKEWKEDEFMPGIFKRGTTEEK
jgi:hypothetical protein